MILYNSATHQREEFVPNEPGKVSMYTCGPTVYHFAHIGNLRTYIMEDILDRYLRYSGYEVKRVMNITDVGHLSSDGDTGEDKMLKGAKREKKSVMEIAKFYTDCFFADAAKLNIRRPDVVEPATNCIDEFIKVIESLIEKGFAYEAGGNIYFDTATGSYKTIEGKEYTIDVAKGASQASPTGNVYVVKEDGKMLANDIRYIKLGAAGNDDDKFFASSLYWLLYIVSLLLFAVAVFVYRKRIKDNENITLVKTKKANSVAVRRLKNAKKLLSDNRINEFYDETLKAVWGYMSDKLNIPLSRLSKDNISSELARRGCDETLVADLLSLLNECEFARYAPGDPGATMDKVYKMAVSVISKMENSIRK